MDRLRIPLLALCLLLLSWGAASAQPPLVTPIRVGNPDAPLTLDVWAQQDYSHLASRPAIAQVFTDVFTDWARATRDVQLRISVMPALEQHKAKLLLAASAGRLPDIASIDSFWLPLFLDNGAVQPLDEWWPADDRADFLPFTISTLSDAAGRVYGLWHETDCRVLYYRKDLVPVPPRSWDELLETASRISRERKIAGYLYNAGRWEATVFDHLAMFWAQGGELVDDGGRPVFGEGQNRQRMIDLLAFLRRTIETGASPRSVLASMDYQQLTSAAAAGDVAMFLGGNWQLEDLKANLRAEEFAKWDIAPIPQKDPRTASTGTGGWIWVVFAKDPERQRAAVEFIRRVEAPANAARISEATGHLPVRRSVYQQFPVFREGWYARFGEIVESGRARPAVPMYPAISTELQLAIGYAVAGERTPEQAVDAAYRNVMQLWQRRSTGRQDTGGADLTGWLPALIAGALLAWVFVRGRDATPRAWLAPAAVLAGVFVLYPVLELVRLSFTRATTGQRVSEYTLDSFTELLSDPHFAPMLTVTVVFVVASVTLQLALGFGMAYLMDAARRRRVPGGLAARVAVVSAWVVPGVLVGVLWKILLMENRSGLVNYWLTSVGVGPLPLLSSGDFALASVILANTWRGCAFSMVLQYAGLQRIPRELHEAADLEGASTLQRLRVVVLPAVAPVIALNAVLITLYTFNTFDLILPLTGGGPTRSTEVASLFMYRLAFYDLNAGMASAAAVVMLVFNLPLIWAATRLASGRPLRRRLEVAA
ncbi:MAG TPA: extracellular solute-binding protein [Vicinamibacterales bacterium]|nr:extracellular solute-binding protein [Vicinamibacterales bacterium]